VIFFIGAAFCIFKVWEFARAAPREKTTTAHVVRVYHSIFRGLRFNYYSCSYNFSIEQSYYVGLGDCPQGIADDARNGKYLDVSWLSPGIDATVYYDPDDPSVSSLLEFRAARDVYLQTAAPWIGLATLSIFFIVFGRLLEANEKRGIGGVVVDARGTVIFPEEIGVGSDIAGKPNGGGTNGTPSPGLRELYLEVVNRIHPDRAANEDDLALRERLTKEANAAFERGDMKTLRRVLEDYMDATPAS
jgi:hypothetical protein